MFKTPRAGKPIDYRHLIYCYFRPLLERDGLPTNRLHDLRHTYATLLLSQGEHPKIVADVLGHANISMTLDTYSHVLPHMQAGAAEAMRAVLEDDEVGGRGDHA